MKYGFAKIAAAVPIVKVADCHYNIEQMTSLIKKAEEKDVEILLFPELSITSVSCADLFHQDTLLNGALEAVHSLLNISSDCETVIIAGAPIRISDALLNCAIVIHRGKIVGIVPKSNFNQEELLNTERWFTPGNFIADTTVKIFDQNVPVGSNILFRTPACTFGIAIGDETTHPTPQSSKLALYGAEIIFNPAAINETAGMYDKLVESCRQQSMRNISGYVHSGCGFGESSSDLVYTGNALIADNGEIIQRGERFATDGQMIIAEIDIQQIRRNRINNKSFTVARSDSEHSRGECIDIVQKEYTGTKLTRIYDAQPFVPRNEEYDNRCREMFTIQAAGLAKRIKHTNAATCVIGISGGLDSTLALLVTVHAFDILKRNRKDITGITMPGFGTTDRTYNNAIALMQQLGITLQEISIKEACIQHFKDIGHDINLHDVTYENAQARERTQLLMDISNKTNGFVVGTGDLSELALGWATYNGDHMSMYSVNASVPKTLVQHLVRWAAENISDKETRSILLDIINTPISPELLPANENGDIKQKTEDLVGPYELHDFFLFHFIKGGCTPKKIFFLAKNTFADKYDDCTIKKWLKTFFRRFFTQQFKRSCTPDGPKVGCISFSPRGDWRMPSDASCSLWLQECEEL